MYILTRDNSLLSPSIVARKKQTPQMLNLQMLNLSAIYLLHTILHCMEIAGHEDIATFYVDVTA
jgi:hypothetical protein